MSKSIKVFIVVVLACIVSAHARQTRDVSHLDDDHGSHGGDDYGSHGKATSYQSNVLHSYHPVPVYVKDAHHGDGGHGGGHH